MICSATYILVSTKCVEQTTYPAILAYVGERVLFDQASIILDSNLEAAWGEIKGVLG